MLQAATSERQKILKQAKACLKDLQQDAKSSSACEPAEAAPASDSPMSAVQHPANNVPAAAIAPKASNVESSTVCAAAANGEASADATSALDTAATGSAAASGFDGPGTEGAQTVAVQRMEGTAFSPCSKEAGRGADARLGQDQREGDGAQIGEKAANMETSHDYAAFASDAAPAASSADLTQPSSLPQLEKKSAHIEGGPFNLQAGLGSRLAAHCPSGDVGKGAALSVPEIEDEAERQGLADVAVVTDETDALGPVSHHGQVRKLMFCPSQSEKVRLATAATSRSSVLCVGVMTCLLQSCDVLFDVQR